MVMIMREDRLYILTLKLYDNQIYVNPYLLKYIFIVKLVEKLAETFNIACFSIEHPHRYEMRQTITVGEYEIEMEDGNLDEVLRIVLKYDSTIIDTVRKIVRKIVETCREVGLKITTEMEIHNIKRIINT